MSETVKISRRKRRNFPNHPLEEALAVPQRIMDEMAGKPFKRLLLAEALGIKPASSNYKLLLSSSFKYGLTEGTEKAREISITELGKAAILIGDRNKRHSARRKAAVIPEIFRRFFEDYRDRKLPSSEMLDKILVSEYNVVEEHAQECARLLLENGRFTEIIRDISGSPHIILEMQQSQIVDEIRESNELENEKESTVIAESGGQSPALLQPDTASDQIDRGGFPKPKPIFIGHGKNTQPLQKLEKILISFEIPFKVTTSEANLGRPIPQKVKETMEECGSGILIFTRDEKFFDEQGNEFWRASENVVHELGAASLLYEDRIVIFKEKGLHLPTNFDSIGYHEFEVDSIDSKTTELLKELIGFGIVKVTPV